MERHKEICPILFSEMFSLIRSKFCLRALDAIWDGHNSEKLKPTEKRRYKNKKKSEPPEFYKMDRLV